MFHLNKELSLFSEIPECAQKKESLDLVRKSELSQELLFMCPVKGYPKPTAISWGIRNSDTGLTTRFPQQRQLEKVFRYTPKTPDDFGTILCWASNEMGEMKEPCHFPIAASGKTRNNLNIFTKISVNFVYIIDSRVRWLILSINPYRPIPS